MKPIKWWPRLGKPSNNIDLDRYFSTLKNVDYEDSFTDINNWLVRMNQSKDINYIKERTLKQRTHQMINYFGTHRVRFAVVIVALVVGFIACTMPIEQEKTIGYLLSGEIDKKNKEAMISINSFTWVDPTKLSVAIHEHKGNLKTIEEKTKFAIVLPDAEREQAERWKRDLESLDGAKAISLKLIEESVKRPAYEAALGNIFKMEVKVSEGQIENSIKEQLEFLHMEGIDVKHVTNLNGDRILELSTTRKDLDRLENKHMNQFIYEVDPPQSNDKEKLELIHERRE